VSDIGLKMLKVVPNALFDELKHVVYVPDKDNSYSDKVQISWDPVKEEFSMRSGKTGYVRSSTITEIEDVSYCCSPFIPQVICLEFSSPTKSALEDVLKAQCPLPSSIPVTRSPKKPIPKILEFPKSSVRHSSFDGGLGPKP
jgi:hypothetical protein